MILITYFLMNDNHASDSWAFAGILIRQAYALALNRDPSTLSIGQPPRPLTHFEKQQRRKIWQAVFMQDTFLTILLQLPPTAYQFDVRIEDLAEEGDTVVNSGGTDVSYIRSMWLLADIVQTRICQKRSLHIPICTSSSERSELISSFNRIYNSFPLPFRDFTEPSICDLMCRSRRLTLQTLFLSSNYFHCLMLINVDESKGLPIDVRGTLEAAHLAVKSFFLLHTLFEEEARIWYHAQNKAFMEAVRSCPALLPI